MLSVAHTTVCLWNWWHWAFLCMTWTQGWELAANCLYLTSHLTGRLRSVVRCLLVLRRCGNDGPACWIRPNTHMLSRAHGNINGFPLLHLSWALPPLSTLKRFWTKRSVFVCFVLLMRCMFWSSLGVYRCLHCGKQSSVIGLFPFSFRSFLFLQDIGRNHSLVTRVAMEEVIFIPH